MLVGTEASLASAAKIIPASVAGRVSHVIATEVVGMDESPALSLKNKKNSSLRLALNAVKDGQAAACVSAGNTGALMAMAKFVLQRGLRFCGRVRGQRCAVLFLVECDLLEVRHGEIGGPQALHGGADLAVGRLHALLQPLDFLEQDAQAPLVGHLQQLGQRNGGLEGAVEGVNEQHHHTLARGMGIEQCAATHQNRAGRRLG
mgnify:CR=1 FL=1